MELVTRIMWRLVVGSSVGRPDLFIFWINFMILEGNLGKMWKV